MNITQLKESRVTGHAFAIICVLIWGTTFIISKNLMSYISPVQLMWTRFVIAYIMLWILHPRLHFKLKDEIWLFITSQFANTLYFLAENTALTMTQTSNVSILVTTAPIITAILLRIFKNEKISRIQAGGFTVAFIGIIMIVMNGVVILKLSPKGDILSLLAAASWAVYGILCHRFLHYNSFLLTRKLMFYSILSCTPLLLLNGDVPDFHALLTPANIAGLLYLGFAASAVCYLLWNTSLQIIGVLKTNLYIYLIPLITLLAGYVFLHERITIMGAAGMLLVIAGLFMGNTGKK